MDLRTAPTPDPAAFLAEDGVVDLRHPAVQAVHHRLAGDDPDDVTYLRRAFEHVRDRVHGLVAVPVDGRWHRLDPRGVDVEFDLAEEALVYRPDPSRGERDVAGVFAASAPEVLAPLRTATDVLRARLADDLPDRR